MDWLTVRPQALFSSPGPDFRDRLCVLRRGAVARSNGYVPPDSGRGRGGDDSLIAGDSDGNVSRGTTADCDGDLGNGADGSADRRPHAGRLDHRQLELAVEFLPQSA